MHIPTYTGDTPSEFTLSCYTETCFIKRKQLQCHPGLHEDTLRYMYADSEHNLLRVPTHMKHRSPCFLNQVRNSIAGPVVLELNENSCLEGITKALG